MIKSFLVFNILLVLISGKPQAPQPDEFSNLLGSEQLPSLDDFLKILDENVQSAPDQTLDLDQIFAQELIKNDILPQTVEPETIPPTCTCVSNDRCGDSTSAIGQVNVSGVIKVEDLRKQGQLCENALDVCCQNVQQATTQTKTVASKTCGIRNPLGVEVNVAFFQDQQSQYGEFPWTVPILGPRNAQGSYPFFCGGSLIHPQVVLTAAHRVYNIQNQEFKIRAGEWNIETKEEPFPEEDITVSQIVVHPQFHISHLKYNVALLFLSRPVTLSQHINTVCLPSETELHDEVKCISSGWGQNSFQKGNYQTIMKKVTVPIVNNLACSNALKSTNRLPQNFGIDESSICAGGNGADTCTGDGGSPLVCKKLDGSNKYVQVGVVAWGLECNLDGIPGVYASVKAAIPWIRAQVTARYGSDAVSYFT